MSWRKTIVEQFFRSATVITFGFLLVTSFVLYQRVGVFGCFDECPNYAVGYFLSQGRQLYSQIFFNHQPFLPFISFFIQHIGNPQTLYELVRMHRMFVVVFSLGLNSMLIWRFGWVGLVFSVLFDSTKFYAMGSLFLGESLVVYLYVYVFLVTSQLVLQRTGKTIDFIIVPCMIWIGLFLREPYIPLAVFLFASYIIIIRQYRVASLGLFIGLTFITLRQFSLIDYWFNVVIVNFQTLLTQEMQKVNIEGLGIVKPFIYPILIWFGGEWNIYRFIQCSVSAGALIFGFILGRKGRKVQAFFVWTCVALGLSAIRYVPPGTLYYEAFHLLPWWGLMIASLCLFAREFWVSHNERWQQNVVVIYFISVVLLIFSPKSFYWERFDKKAEFSTGYSRYSLYSDAITSISNKNNTLFIDMWDDVLYVTTHLTPAYEYSWYIPVMSSFGKYTDARTAMFAKNAPDFYYYSCEKKENMVPINSFEQSHYVRLVKNGIPSCIFVRKSVLETISKEKRVSLFRLGFSIPQ